CEEEFESAATSLRFYFSFLLAERLKTRDHRGDSPPECRDCKTQLGGHRQPRKGGASCGAKRLPFTAATRSIRRRVPWPSRSTRRSPMHSTAPSTEQPSSIS